MVTWYIFSAFFTCLYFNIWNEFFFVDSFLGLVRIYIQMTKPMPQVMAHVKTKSPFCPHSGNFIILRELIFISGFLCWSMSRAMGCFFGPWPFDFLLALAALLLKQAYKSYKVTRLSLQNPPLGGKLKGSFFWCSDHLIRLGSLATLSLGRQTLSLGPEIVG